MAALSKRWQVWAAGQRARVSIQPRCQRMLTPDLIAAEIVYGGDETSTLARQVLDKLKGGVRAATFALIGEKDALDNHQGAHPRDRRSKRQPKHRHQFLGGYSAGPGPTQFIRVG